MSYLPSDAELFILCWIPHGSALFLARKGTHRLEVSMGLGANQDASSRIAQSSTVRISLRGVMAAHHFPFAIAYIGSMAWDGQ